MVNTNHSNYDCTKCYGTGIRGYRVFPNPYWEKEGAVNEYGKPQKFFDFKFPIKCKCVTKKEKANDITLTGDNPAQPSTGAEGDGETGEGSEDMLPFPSPCI